MPSIFTLEGPKLRPVACDPRTVDPEQLRIGTLVELEHTKDLATAQRIALHHLCETYPHPYYIVGAGVPRERLLLNGLAMTPTAAYWLQLAAALVLGATGFLVYSRARKGRPLFGIGDPKRIAQESKTVEEYARRVEAWNASEAKPQSLTKLAKAWAGGRDPSKTIRLLREAREARVEGRERLWSRMSRGLV